MSCVCQSSGFCERHQVNKNDHLHKLCQNHKGYFDKWEEGRGPLQPAKGLPRAIRKKGPGSHLKDLLAEKGYRIKSQGCGCNSKAKKMDSWGVKKCRNKIDEIIGWLEESAKEAGWLERLVVTAPFVKNFARKEIEKLVHEAIARSEHEQSNLKEVKDV